MPALVIKDLPAELHRRLKTEARQRHRSMTQQAIALLVQGLQGVPQVPRIKPYQGARSLTNAFIADAKRQGRE